MKRKKKQQRQCYVFDIFLTFDYALPLLGYIYIHTQFIKQTKKLTFRVKY